MMFRRVVFLVSEYAKEQNPSPDMPPWIERFARLEEKSNQSVFIDEQLFSAEEIEHLSDAVLDCAQAIYERRVGNQDNQHWQIATIWAMYTLARMLWREHTRLTQGSGLTDPPWRLADRKQVDRLNRKIARAMQERDEIWMHMYPPYHPSE